MARGPLDGADAALHTVLPEASDPELAATRAELSRRRGDLADAARQDATARARYLALLERHPDAFADHAARFFLDREPDRALRWASHNLEVRRTPDAFDLALTAALRAEDAPARCDIARHARGLALRTSRLETLIADGLRACHEDEPGGHGGASR
jgi:hypothetical protein